jgi:hypothetical protein
MFVFRVETQSLGRIQGRLQFDFLAAAARTSGTTLGSPAAGAGVRVVAFTPRPATERPIDVKFPQSRVMEKSSHTILWPESSGNGALTDRPATVMPSQFDARHIQPP